MIRNHAGAGLHIWNPTAPTRTVYIEANRFEDNVIEAVLSHVEQGIFKSNVFVHKSHPATNAPRSALLWLEFSRNLLFEGNAFTYGISSSDPLPAAFIHWYRSDQDGNELQWRSNTWTLPSTSPPITDADIERAGL